MEGFVPDPVLVSRYIKRGSKRNLVVIKRDLDRFAKEDVVHPDRRTQLTTELRLYGLSFPEGNQLCKNYIEGCTSASLEEVVASMRLARYLVDVGGEDYWRKNAPTLGAMMRESMLVGKTCSWHEAFENVKEHWNYLL